MEMERITLYIGSCRVCDDGHVISRDRPVEFVGRKLAELNEYEYGRTRGVDQTLYEVEDGRLVVYVKYWTNWVGEASKRWLVLVSEKDLQPGGEYEMIGRKAGLSRPLTVDEALSDTK